MLSCRRKSLDSLIRRPLVLTNSASRLRVWATNAKGLRHPPNGYSCRATRPNIRQRYFSSENEASLEDCARSISQAVTNNNGQQQSSISLESAFELARKLSPEARQEVVVALSGNPAPAMTEAVPQEVPPPTLDDLRLIALAQAIPFLGFGIMDNGILIIAGDAIDTSLGVVLGISTLCAAAIGNIISDVAGIMMGTVIEDFCTQYLKLPMPNLTNAQRQLRSVRFASQFGMGVGLVIGCIIGMLPLMWIDSKKIQVLKRDAALHNIFQDVMSEAKTLIGAESASLFIVVENDPETNESVIPNPDGQYLYAKFFHSDSGTVSHRTFKIGQGIVSRAALTGQAWNIHDVDSEPDYSHEMTGQEQRVKHMAVAPVLDSNGKTIAVIRAFNKVAEGSLVGGTDAVKAGEKRKVLRRGFTNNDMQVLKALASHISVSLQIMYQDKGEEAAAVGIKDTIRILKEHGLAGIAEDKTSTFNRRRPLFPEE